MVEKDFGSHWDEDERNIFERSSFCLLKLQHGLNFQLNTIVTLMAADYSPIAQTFTTRYLLPQAAVAVKRKRLHTLTNYGFFLG